jgi:hypothetical protein
VSVVCSGHGIFGLLVWGEHVPLAWTHVPLFAPAALTVINMAAGCAYTPCICHAEATFLLALALSWPRSSDRWCTCNRAIWRSTSTRQLPMVYFACTLHAKQRAPSLLHAHGWAGAEPSSLLLPVHALLTRQRRPFDARRCKVKVWKRSTTYVPPCLHASVCDPRCQEPFWAPSLHHVVCRRTRTT